MVFANDILGLADQLATDRKHYRLIEQFEAAVTSIPMNIAEGKARYSKKEFAHFLHIARGSLFETTTLVEIFEMRHWISPEICQQMTSQADEIGKMLNGLNRSLD